MLSVDLSSPAVKNKMSKREFIKNTCRAVQTVNDDLAGDLYDNIYLIGHVATEGLRWPIAIEVIDFFFVCV